MRPDVTPNHYLTKLLSYRRVRNISFQRSLFRTQAQEEVFVMEAEQKGIKVLLSPAMVFLEKPKKARKKQNRKSSRR